jgi:hypothetical protein
MASQVNRSNTSGVSGSWDAPVNVAYPHPSDNPDLPGSVVLFPSVEHARQFASHAWEQLKDEYQENVAPTVQKVSRFG